MSRDGEMTTRTRPGAVPPRVETMPGIAWAPEDPGDEAGQSLAAIPPLRPALSEVIEGRALYPGDPGAEDDAPTIADRIEDLEAADKARDRAHRALEGVVDQLTAQVQELRRQLGLSDWRPEYRSERP